MLHPHWCLRTECSAAAPNGAGGHVSRACVLDRDEVTFLAAEVRLVQAAPIGGYPRSDLVLVELTLNLPTYDPRVPEEEFSIVLSGRHAESLGYLLRSAGRAATT